MLPEKKQGVKKKPDFLHLEWRKSISSCRHCLVIASFAALLLVLFCTVRIIHAGRITLEWDPVPHPDLAGYMVYYGTFSGDYDESVDVGNWTSVTIEGLEEDETYYFSVTAYSVNGGESEYSNEVCNNSAICDTASSSGGGGLLYRHCSPRFICAISSEAPGGIQGSISADQSAWKEFLQVVL